MNNYRGVGGTWYFCVMQHDAKPGSGWLSLVATSRIRSEGEARKHFKSYLDSSKYSLVKLSEETIQRLINNVGTRTS